MRPKYPTKAPSKAPLYVRTDLACESPSPAAETEEETLPAGSRPVTVTRRKETDGGYSVTLSIGRITERGEGDLSPLADVLASELRRMATRMLRRALRRPDEAESPAKIARCKEMLAILLEKTDSICFG